MISYSHFGHEITRLFPSDKSWKQSDKTFLSYLFQHRMADFLFNAQ